jgi:hypothetical protein
VTLAAQVLIVQSLKRSKLFTDPRDRRSYIPCQFFVRTYQRSNRAMRVNIIRLFFLTAAVAGFLQHVNSNSAIPAVAAEPILLLLLGTGLIAATRPYR